MLRFDEFSTRVTTALRVELPDPPDQFDARSNLYDELGLDSFQAFELIIIVETLADSHVPPATLPELYTLGDAYQYYETLARAQAE